MLFHQLDASIARIFNQSKTPVGAGFVISDNLIATCSHVVLGALGLKHHPNDKSELFVDVDFPFIAPGKIRKARVFDWQQRQPDGSGDVAILELNKEDIPGQIKTANKFWGAVLWNDTFRVYGFPKTHINGFWVHGRLFGQQISGRFQIETDMESGYSIEEGFSGSPVWDNEKEAVVGLVIDLEKAAEKKVATALPVNQILEAFPFLADKVAGVSPVSYQPPKPLADLLSKYPYVVLWLQWVLVTTLGWGIGAFYGLIQSFLLLCLWPIIVVVQWLILKRSIVRAGRWTILSIGLLFLIALLSLNFNGAIFWASFGFTIGTIQWIVLRQMLPKAGWWAYATAIGWIIGYILLRILEGRWTLQSNLTNEQFLANLSSRFAISVGVGGVIASLLQWFILRRQIPKSFWWIISNGIYWFLAALFVVQISNPFQKIFIILSSIVKGDNSAYNQLWTTSRPIVINCVFGFLGVGIVLGVVTGFVLIRLRKHYTS